MIIYWKPRNVVAECFKESHGNFPNGATWIVRSRWLTGKCLLYKCSTLWRYVNTLWSPSSAWSTVFNGHVLACFRSFLSGLSNLSEGQFFPSCKNPAHLYNVTLVSNIKILPTYFPGLIPCLMLKPLCPRSIYYVLCFPRGNPTNRVISTRSFFIIDLPTNNQESRDWLEHWILASEPIWVRSAIVLLVTWRRPPLQPIQEPPLVSHILPRGFPTHSCTKSLYQSITHIGHKLKFLFHIQKKLKTDTERVLHLSTITQS